MLLNSFVQLQIVFKIFIHEEYAFKVCTDLTHVHKNGDIKLWMPLILTTLSKMIIVIVTVRGTQKEQGFWYSQPFSEKSSREFYNLRHFHWFYPCALKHRKLEPLKSMSWKYFHYVILKYNSNTVVTRWSGKWHEAVNERKNCQISRCIKRD